MRVALPEKAPLSATSETSAWLLGFSPCSESGEDKPAGHVPGGGAGKEFGAASWESLQS